MNHSFNNLPSRRGGETVINFDFVFPAARWSVSLRWKDRCCIGIDSEGALKKHLPQLFPPHRAENDRTGDPKKPGDQFDTSHLESDLKGRSIRGGAVTIGGQAARFVIHMGSNIVLARLLAPSVFGLVAMVTAVTGFAQLFKDLGLSMATIQKASITQRQISAMFWVNVAVSMLIALLITALAPAVAWFYGEPRLTAITAALALSFLFGGLTVQPQALLRRQMRYGILTAVDVAAMLLGASSAIAAALLGAGYWALVINQLVHAFCVAAGTWIFSRWRPGFIIRNAGIREMLHFGANLTGFNILNYFARNLDNILIGKVWGTVSLGLYTKAYSLLMLPLQQINAPISAVAVPTLSRLQDDPKRYRTYYLKTIRLITSLTMPGMMFLIVMADEVILLLLGPQWSETSRIFMVLGISGLMQPVANSTGWLFISQGRTREMFRWGFIGSGKTVLAILAGLPWGAFGVAVSYTAVGLVTGPLLYWFVGRTGPVGFRDIYRALGTPLLISFGVLFSLVVLKTFSGTTHPLLLVIEALGVTVFTCGLFLLLIPGGRKLRREAVEAASHLKGGYR